MSTRENRRAKRTAHDSVLELFDGDGHVITGIGRLVDFSTVGACFSTPQQLKVGEKVSGRLRLLKEGVLQITAHVVWTRQKPNTRLYGIEFEKVEKVR